MYQMYEDSAITGNSAYILSRGQYMLGLQVDQPYADLRLLTQRGGEADL
jgi:hypothetical protein